MQKKKIHFIGICGVAMSALALAFKKQGWKVTGSDVGIYPPISTYLKESGIDYYGGWHPEKVLSMFKDGGENNEIVVVGNVASSTNPEWAYTQERQLNFKSYPEIIKEFFVKEKSVVCAGTYGKTTSTALLTWIFKEAGLNPTYMFGGLLARSNNSDSAGPIHELPLQPNNVQRQIPSAEITDSSWSILEGDEYKASRWDNGPKFAYYSPTHLLLTSVVWDHADVYPTEEAYFQAFKKLISAVPKNGLCVLSEKVGSPCNTPRQTAPIIRYGKEESNDYRYENVIQTTRGISCDIFYGEQKYSLTIPCLGEYMADNATGCFALAHQLGIEPAVIVRAITTFPGMRRRLEKRYEGSVTVFDDIAHSPSKAEATLHSLRTIYKKKIIAIFEPNTGNRQQQAIPWYDFAFKDADIVVMPTLTKIKKNPNEPDPLEAGQLRTIIAKTHKQVWNIGDDTELVDVILKEVADGDVVVFLGSHGFRRMIEQVVDRLRQ